MCIRDEAPAKRWYAVLQCTALWCLFLCCMMWVLQHERSSLVVLADDADAADRPLRKMAAILPQADADDSFCHWKRIQFASFMAPPELCLRARGTDALSDVVHALAYWPDCDDLVPMLMSSSVDGGGLFVDVGANLGACTLRVAAERRWMVHAFESEPTNLRHLRAGLRRMAARPPWVTVHTTELGGTSTTLDAELWPDEAAEPPRIRVLKLDVQGPHEVLRGARRLFTARAIAAIKTKKKTRALCALLADAGFGFRDAMVASLPLYTSVDRCAIGNSDLLAFLRPTNA